MNKIIKLLIIIITIFFLSLYFSNYNNEYYENKTYLTQEAIKNYEKDLKEGKIILGDKYLPKEKNYNNSISKLGLKSSSLIEKLINRGLKYILGYLD